MPGVGTPAIVRLSLHKNTLPSAHVGRCPLNLWCPSHIWCMCMHSKAPKCMVPQCHVVWCGTILKTMPVFFFCAFHTCNFSGLPWTCWAGAWKKHGCSDAPYDVNKPIMKRTFLGNIKRLRSRFNSLLLDGLFTPGVVLRCWAAIPVLSNSKTRQSVISYQANSHTCVTTVWPKISVGATEGGLFCLHAESALR